MKKFRIGLLPRIIIAIVLGIGTGFVMPEVVVRLFVTFNGLFSQFLGFIIPLIIVAHNGTTNPATPSSTPLAIVWRSVTGMVAADDDVPSAVKYAGSILRGAWHRAVFHGRHPRAVEHYDCACDGLHRGTWTRTSEIHSAARRVCRLEGYNR